MRSTNVNLSPIPSNNVEPGDQLKNGVLIICFGILVALLMHGDLGQWLVYLSEHNFAINAGALFQNQSALTP